MDSLVDINYLKSLKKRSDSIFLINYSPDLSSKKLGAFLQKGPEITILLSDLQNHKSGKKMTDKPYPPADRHQFTDDVAVNKVELICC